MKKISEPLKVILNHLEDTTTSSDFTKGLKTGFQSLDQMINGLKRGELILIGARPALGKSTLALQIAYQSCRESKLPVAYFSSDTLAEDLAFSLLTIASQVDAKKMRKKELQAADLKKIVSTTKELTSLPIYINDAYSLSVEEIANQCRTLKKENDLSLVVVDYLQLIKGDENCRREEQIGKIMFDLKAMARELDCPVIILSQLSRSVESRPNRRPHLNDFRESGTIEQIADVILLIYRDEVYNPDTLEPGIAEIFVAKDRRNGLGTCKLLWKRNYRSFEDFR